MSIQLRFIITLKTDWHVSAGYGLSSLADSAIKRDPDGIPIIPGSTIRGLFRDALYDLGRIEYLNPTGHKDPRSLPDSVLGSPQAESRWKFHKARPRELPHLTTLNAREGADMAVMATGVRVSPKTRRAEQGKFFTRELGQGATEFVFAVEGEGNQEDIEWLVVAARYTRHLGGRRRRGGGSCRIALDDNSLQEASLQAFEQRHASTSSPVIIPVKVSPVERPYDAARDQHVKDHRFRLILRADEPLLVAARAEAGNNFQGRLSIPGQTLRGALAALVGPDGNGPAYQTFKWLFVQGGAAFGSLTLLETDKAAQSGVLVDEVPLGLLGPIRPADDVKSLVDAQSLLWDLREETQGYKPRKGYYSQRDGLPKYDAPELEADVHVRINEDLKRASTGDLYSYQPVPAGSFFAGEIQLRGDSQWHELGDLLRVNLGQPFPLRIGKGQGRGYGQCTAWLEPLPDDAPPLWSQMALADRLQLSTPLEDGQGYRLLVTLASDTILLDPWGRAIRRFDEGCLKNELPELAIVRVEVQAVQNCLVEGFDVRSGLPRWRDVALAKGSTALLVTGANPQKILDALMTRERDGIGLRRIEGYGRVIFNHPAHTHLAAGFAKPIVIPPELRPKADDHLLPAAFDKQWRADLASALRVKAFDGGVYRTLARRLVEEHPRDFKAAGALLDTLGKLPEEWADRKSKGRFEPETMMHTKELLKYLDEKYPAYWARGVVILAEAILNAVKQVEEEKRGGPNA